MRSLRFDLSEIELEEHRRYELNIPKDWKLLVWDRDGWQCRRCNRVSELTLHHIIPRSHHRDHIPANLVTLCWSCHRLIHDGFVWLYRDDDGNFFFGGSRSDLLR